MLSLLQNQNTSVRTKYFTHFGEYNNVLSMALWTGNFCCTVASLFLIYPSLHTVLMNPHCGTTTTAWLDPGRLKVIFICSQAHPAYSPARKQQLLNFNLITVLFFIYLNFGKNIGAQLQLARN